MRGEGPPPLPGLRGQSPPAVPSTRSSAAPARLHPRRIPWCLQGKDPGNFTGKFFPV